MNRPYAICCYLGFQTWTRPGGCPHVSVAPPSTAAFGEIGSTDPFLLAAVEGGATVGMAWSVPKIIFSQTIEAKT